MFSNATIEKFECGYLVATVSSAAARLTLGSMSGSPSFLMMRVTLLNGSHRSCTPPVELVVGDWHASVVDCFGGGCDRWVLVDEVVKCVPGLALAE